VAKGFIKMLKKEQNDLLTRTGPGTEMGRLFRSYWLPALLAEELIDNGGPPVRVKLLSERLVAWRDGQGRYSLIDEFCAHRGTSLWVGRNEGDGLRCPYHGWKYDWTGQCMEVPSEPEESGYFRKIKLRSYPLVKRGEILWTYMGPPEYQPPLPEFEFVMVPPEQTYVSKRLQECNWLQALEGGIDSSHVSWLHGRSLELDALHRGSASISYNLADRRPYFEVVESSGGLLIGARRNADDRKYYWRITQWIMPCVTMIAPRGDYPAGGHFWIPIDDESCWTWNWDYHAVRPLTRDERTAMKNGAGRHVVYEAGNTWRAKANKDNDYLIDRESQKAGISYSGIAGAAMQDSGIQELMGPIVDRTKENLVSTDNGIIMARHRLMRVAKALSEQGKLPPGVDPAHHRVRAASVLLPVDEAFQDAAEEALKVRSHSDHARV
jgi:phenylpropionate dioxygenase-like ring-hydroxylating dioxygenase large terminal subunit